jgi:hypothetical protein
MTEVDSATTDRSLHGVRIAELISGIIFTAALLYTVPECAEGGAPNRRRGR